MKKPNILFISTDQLRFDCVGYQNRYPVKTPNIDRLAREGISFNHSYTPLPICCPARQALICGKRPEQFGALWNYDMGIPTASLPKEAFSWARELKKAGYKNGYVGKWHVSPTLTPLDFGYDEYISEHELHVKAKERHPNHTYQTKGFWGEVSPLPVEDSLTHLNAESVLSLIDKYETPWHIKMDFAEPHLPCRPSEPFASMYPSVPKWAAFDDPLLNKPYIQKQQLLNWDTKDKSWDEFEEMVRRYYAYISQVDDAIGKVLAHLEESGQLDDTLIVFTADHGDLAGERHMMDKHYVMYDEVVRVPLTMRYPALIPAGVACDDFVINMLDLVPTILEITESEVPIDLQGKSLVPCFGGKGMPHPRAYALSTYSGQQFGLYTQRMIRNHKWKYIWNPTDTDELYDMETDPHELTNVIGEKSLHEVIKQLRIDLVKELDEAKDGVIKSPWLREQLLHNRKL